MKRKKRDKVDRAFLQGYKSGLRGHEMEDCPHFDLEPRGSWFAGWREGRSNHISGYIIFPERQLHHETSMHTHR